MIDLFIFRHGETDWNKEGRIQGHTDIPLNDKGRSQARQLRPALADFAPQVILTSDLSRAVETAQIARYKMPTPIVIKPELREAYLGKVEGMRKETALKIYGQSLLDSWDSNLAEHIHAQLPESESKLSHQRRLLKCLADYASENSNIKRIAVSTHHASIARIIYGCSNAPSTTIPITNGSIFIVTLDTKSIKWIFRGASYV